MIPERFPQGGVALACSNVANAAVPDTDCTLPAVEVKESVGPTLLFPLLVPPPPAH